MRKPNDNAVNMTAIICVTIILAVVTWKDSDFAWLVLLWAFTLFA